MFVFLKKLPKISPLKAHAQHNLRIQTATACRNKTFRPTLSEKARFLLTQATSAGNNEVRNVRNV